MYQSTRCISAREISEIWSRQALSKKSLEALPVSNGVNGKSDKFTRPIFVFKKYDRYSFLGLPLTTKSKIGSWYVFISFNGIKQTVVLSQGRSFDYRRFKEKIGELDEGDREKIKKAYADLHISPLEPIHDLTAKL
jgi:hypothetical protein